MARGVFSNINRFESTSGESLTQPLTAAGWMYYTATTGTQSPCELISASSPWNEMRFYTNPGTLRFYTAIKGTGNAYPQGPDLTLNTWHHVACVSANSTSHTVYVDGVPGTTSTVSAVITGVSRACFGALTSGAYPLAYGYIAEWGVWEAALTQADLTSLAAGFTAPFVRPDALVGYYQFLKSTGDQIDQSHGHDTIENGTVGAFAHPPLRKPAARQATRLGQLERGGGFALESRERIGELVKVTVHWRTDFRTRCVQIPLSITGQLLRYQSQHYDTTTVGSTYTVQLLDDLGSDRLRTHCEDLLYNMVRGDEITASYDAPSVTYQNPPALGEHTFKVQTAGGQTFGVFDLWVKPWPDESGIIR